jgi:sporulation integral membrane protein YtvI
LKDLLTTPKRLFILVTLIALAVLVYFNQFAFMPFILAIVTAFLLEPVVRFVQRQLRLKSRFPAVIIVFILFVCFITFVLFWVITRLVSEAVKIVERLPYYLTEVTLYIESLLIRFNEAVAGLPPFVISELEAQLNLLFDKANLLTQQIIPILTSWVSAIPNLLIVVVVYLISLFLISLHLPRYMEAFYARFKEENAEKVRYMIQRATRFFVGFFKAQFLVSIIIFIVSYIGLLIIAPRNALIMALIIWLIDFIPLIGSIMILAPWGLFDLLTGNTETGVGLLILAAILLVIRRTVEPKVMGDQIGLPALPTLIGLWLGFYFFGLIGLIIGPLSIIAILSAKEAGLIKMNFKI